MITVKKSEYNKAKLRKLFKEASQQYIQITDEEAQELGLIEQTPTGPTGEQEPETPTGITEPQGPTSVPEPTEEYNYEFCDFGINGIGYKILSLNELTVQVFRLFIHNDIIIPNEVIYNNVIFKVIEISRDWWGGNLMGMNYCNTLKINKYINITKGLPECTYYYVDEENPYMTTINGILYSKDLKILLYYPTKNRNNEFIVPNTVEIIGSIRNEYLTSIIMNDNVKNINNSLILDNLLYIKLSNNIKDIDCIHFLDAVKIKTIIFPQNLERILTNYWGYSFSDSIENITIYNSNIINYKYIKHIKEGDGYGTVKQDCYEISDTYVFGRLQNLKNIYVIDSNPIPLNEDIFVDLKYFTIKVYVPKGCKSIYENTEGWNKFYNIIEVEE